MKALNRNNPCCRRCKSDRVVRNGYVYRADEISMISFKCRECKHLFYDLAENYIIPQPKQGNPLCNQCGNPARRNGTNKARGVTIQRYYCNNCRIGFREEVLNKYHPC